MVETASMVIKTRELELEPERAGLVSGRSFSGVEEGKLVNSTAARLEPEVAVSPKKIWIDLENSPHVPFFKPIIEALERRGHSIVVTARDCFQVCDLADLFQLQYRRIGRHYGKHKLAKVAGLGIRVMQMTPGMFREKPDLSLSHGSRSQIVVSSLLGVPNVTIFDYEHSAHMRIFKPGWVMAPEVVVQAGGCADIPKDRLLSYPGIKEDVYAPSFKPDPAIKQELGLKADDLVVTIRPPATEAHYHNPEAEGLLTAVFQLLGKLPQSKIVLVPRTPKQGHDLKRQFPEMFRDKKAIIPERVVDGLDLIWFSDLVISGGGTMNREAAALGVPVYSIFRGKIGAVDHYLASEGRLVMLESVADVNTKIKTGYRQKSSQRAQAASSPALDAVVDNIQHALNVEAAGNPRRR
jgi:predicted glycosyltransferase